MQSPNYALGGSPRKNSIRLETPERFWAARRDHRLIEIGLEGDLVDWAEFVRSGHGASEADTISNIWRASHDEPEVTAYTASDGRLILRIGALTDRQSAACRVVSSS